jgi:osmoprotectant transport system ATP-binding protein
VTAKLLTSGAPQAGAPEVPLGASLYDALAAMLTAGTDRVLVTDPAGQPQGTLTREAIFTGPTGLPG